ncbi:GTPase IMAP family member 7 [Salminus brasiliensis]|uniref:GTPase IMAP family member 7 n=1 Tax=Salminus brasiliensis TaxID=930266 RepID=UPI003B83077B
MASSEGHPTPTRRRKSITEPPFLSSEDTSLRIVVFGNSGPHQLSLTESILREAVLIGADPNTTLTTKTSGRVLNRDVVLVNTPNLSNLSLSHDALKKAIRKSVCFSCPGPHAVLLTLHPSDKPFDAYEIFKPVVQYFGESVLNHTVVVLYHERPTEPEDIRELFKKCGQKCFVFNGAQNRQEGSLTRQLLDRIDGIVSEHGIYSNPEFEDAEKRIRKEEKYIEKERVKEVRNMLEELKKRHSGEDLDREVKRYHEKVRSENRERAEMRIAKRLGFTLRLVDYTAAIGKGAFIGAVLGLVMGLEGVVVGASVGAALGSVLGGSVRAAWNYFTGIFRDVHRDYT